MEIKQISDTSLILWWAFNETSVRTIHMKRKHSKFSHRRGLNIVSLHFDWSFTDGSSAHVWRISTST